MIYEEKFLKPVSIYTDGACSGNPGPGGWAAVLKHKQAEKELSGFEANTTNNRMELKAAIEALKALNQSCAVKLHSDSSYLINAFNMGWLERWKQNGFKTSNKTEVENQDMWLELNELAGRHEIEWIKVKGHSNNEYNNRCDALARAEIRRADV